MNEEEKKAIEILEELQDKYKKETNEKIYNDYTVWNAKRYIENIEIILNLIEKQQKEIEELKIRLVDNTHNHIKRLENNYISKDKIREILENSSYPDFAIQKLYELLGE